MKPKACFTASLIALFFLSGLQSVFAQYDYWSVPAPASDSVADNRNAIIKELPFNNEFSNFIFWERSEDSISTDIYYRNLYTQDEPEVLVTGGGFHYTNPRIISTYNYEDDTLFFLFYQSDQNGNADIYYKFYTNDGFSEPVLFAGTQADETHFRCNDAGYMTWQEGDKIKTRRLFKDYYHPYFTLTDPVTLDSLDVSEPEIPSDISGYFPYVSWLKTDADSISIWYSYEMGDSWSEPSLFYGTGINTSSGFAISSCIYLGNLIFTWDNLAGSEHSIYACNGEDDCFVSDFHQQSSFMPVMSDYIIPVGNFNETGFLAFVRSDGQNDDIYVNEFYDVTPYLEDYVNLSDSPYPETNPAFFNGQCPLDVCDLVLIWESFRNGHWQLFYSIGEVGCWGNINDPASSLAPDLEVSPNPSSGECDIHYIIPADNTVSLSLCTLDGRQTALVNEKYFPKGDYTFHLDLSKIFPGQHYTGALIIKLDAGGQSAVKKLIVVP